MGLSDYKVPIIGCVLGIMVFGIFFSIAYHDDVVSVEAKAKAMPCNSLKYFLDIEEQKIMKTPILNNLKKVYDQRNCNTEVKP